jgi:hypothetical protein
VDFSRARGGRRRSRGEEPATRRAPAAAAPELSWLLALQASAGNQAVARLLSRGPSKAPAPKNPVKAPEVDGWMVEVTPGALGAGVDRKPAVGTTKVFLGDTVTVRADFVNITKADHPSIGYGTIHGGVHPRHPAAQGVRARGHAEVGHPA